LREETRLFPKTIICSQNYDRKIQKNDSSSGEENHLELTRKIGKRESDHKQHGFATLETGNIPNAVVTLFRRAEEGTIRIVR